jgi:hypothetical protein
MSIVKGLASTTPRSNSCRTPIPAIEGFTTMQSRKKQWAKELHKISVWDEAKEQIDNFVANFDRDAVKKFKREDLRSRFGTMNKAYQSAGKLKKWRNKKEYNRISNEIEGNIGAYTKVGVVAEYKQLVDSMTALKRKMQN